MAICVTINSIRVSKTRHHVGRSCQYIYIKEKKKELFYGEIVTWWDSTAVMPHGTATTKADLDLRY